MNRAFVRILIFLCATGFVVVLHVFGILAPIEHGLRRVINPGSRVLYETGLRLSDANVYQSSETLIQAYEELQAEYERLMIDRALLEQLQEENSELRQVLAFFRSTTLPHVNTNVIGKNIEPIGSTILIDRGINAGIRVGDPVIVREGILIGKITRAESDSAVVRLINDNQSKIAATILSVDHSIGLVEGGYGISVRMQFIPQNETVRIDDMVITSGLEERIPRGLVIGKVESVEKEAYQPFQRAIITPATNLGKLFFVSVIVTHPGEE